VFYLTLCYDARKHKFAVPKSRVAPCHLIAYHSVTMNSKAYNSLYSVGVRSSTAVTLANMMHMNMKPAGYFNYTLHRCSRFVFVFDKRAFMSLLLAAFQEMKELQSLTRCSGIVVLEEVGRSVFSNILHRFLFVLCLWFTVLVWRKHCGTKGCRQ